MASYRSKLGPIPDEAFDNDPPLDENVDRSPGSLFDRISRKLDERRLKKFLAKRGHWEDQPRVPAGSPEGGQFGDGGGSVNANAAGADNRVSTTLPSTVAARSSGEAHQRQDLQPSYATFKQAMENPAYAKGVEKVLDRYSDQFLKVPENATPQEKAEAFVEHAKSNLVALYNAQDPELRDRSKEWYEGAHKISGDLSKEYGVSEKSAAAVLASLSPQRDWDQNVDLAQRMLDIHKNRDVPITGEIAARSREAMVAYRDKSQRELDAAEARLPGLTKPSEIHAAEKVIRNRKDTVQTMDELASTFEGRSFAQLPERLQPFAARFVSVGRDPTERGYQIWNPEGTPSGDVGRTARGAPERVGWGGFDQVGNALSVMRDDSNENISRSLGDNHKVRNFYNNIASPNFGRDTTIDTHAIAAGTLMPLGGTSQIVKEGLGVAPPKNAETGLKGLYALHYEAYRRAAREVSTEGRTVLPRQMQSATWEAVRGLYSDVDKKDARIRNAAETIWRRYARGEISLEAAQRQVLAKGIEKPRWAQ